MVFHDLSGDCVLILFPCSIIRKELRWRIYWKINFEGEVYVVSVYVVISVYVVMRNWAHFQTMIVDWMNRLHVKWGVVPATLRSIVDDLRFR